jgi:AcrR family transcriptional regulator
MPRTKTLSDDKVLATALDIIHMRGPEALTFQSVAEACGLSAATLVQRFHSKAELKQRALFLAWDRLDEKTERLARDLPMTPAGAVDFLVALSGDYGGIEAYAEGLLVLREDLRDPALRARGARWQAALSAALDGFFASTPVAPAGIGLLLASHWQGSLLWWGFEPAETLGVYVRKSIEAFLDAILR